MYSKAVYDYFNSSQKKKLKLKPTTLSRTNALKRKTTTKKTVVVSKNTNTSDRILRSSVSKNKDTHLKSAQNSEKKTGGGLVYDTVQSIWKYAKSFIPNQSSSSVSSQERRKRIEGKQRNRVRHSKCLPSTCLNTFPKAILESTQPTKVASDEKFNREQQQSDKEKVDSPIISTEFDKQSVTEIQFEKHLEKQSVCQEIELTNDTNDKAQTEIGLKKDLKKRTVCRKTNKQTKQAFKENALVNKTAEDKQITEIFIKSDTNNNEIAPKNLDVDIIVKSALKAYGRGKRKNKKLHVHFKEDYDNEKPKYSTYRTKILRKSDCVHPNVFLKKLNKFSKKNSNINIRGKKRRYTLCTASSSSRSFRKKRLRKYSSSTISVESKLSDTHDNKVSKTNRKTPKKYSAYATTKINKKKPMKKYKKTITNAKGPKTRQQTKNAANMVLEHLACSPNNGSKEEDNSQLPNMDLRQEITDTEDSDLFGKNKDIPESKDLLENINEFTQFLNGEQLDD